MTSLMFCNQSTRKSTFHSTPKVQVISPRVSSSLNVLVMSSLAARLQKVQSPVDQIVPDLSQFSMEELETHTISFGKAHLGDSFQHVWDTDQKWVHWFISHYPTSSKTSHRFFRHFVEMKVERAELTGIRVPLTEPIVLPEPPASSGHGNPLPESKGSSQSQSSRQKHCTTDQRPRVARGTRSSSGRISVDSRGGHAQCHDRSTGRESPRDPHVEHGERFESGDFAARTSHNVEPTIKPECQSRLDDGYQELHALIDAGDLSHDSIEEILNQDSSSERSAERVRFNRLVQQYQREYDKVTLEPRKKLPRVDIMEIFCGPNSQLTHQCQQLGFRAVRFGKEQCDLQTQQGREQVFRSLHHQQPKNAWFSPSCGPWSNWSCLNGSKSLQAWEELCEARIRHLEQIALGIVIFRHQRIMGDHFHWEQPRGSLMFRLPYLAEAFHYLLSVDFEMCTAGDLVDPQNGKPHP